MVKTAIGFMYRFFDTENRYLDALALLFGLKTLTGLGESANIVWLFHRMLDSHTKINLFY